MTFKYLPVRNLRTVIDKEYINKPDKKSIKQLLVEWGQIISGFAGLAAVIIAILGQYNSNKQFKKNSTSSDSLIASVNNLSKTTNNQLEVAKSQLGIQKDQQKIAESQFNYMINNLRANLRITQVIQLLDPHSGYLIVTPPNVYNFGKQPAKIVKYVIALVNNKDNKIDIKILTAPRDSILRPDSYSHICDQFQIPNKYLNCDVYSYEFVYYKDIIFNTEFVSTPMLTDYIFGEKVLMTMRLATDEQKTKFLNDHQFALREALSKEGIEILPVPVY